jgi:hypothetical protein
MPLFTVRSPYRYRVRSRHVAVAAFALAAFLLAGPAFAQDKPDGKTVLDKIKAGDGLASVKEKLAADPIGARFRVDGFSLNDDKAIKVAGVMLVSGAEDKDRDDAEKQVHNKVIAVVQDVAGAKNFKEFDFEGVKAVRSEKLPHIVLQKAANEAGKTNPALDEVKFNDAKFDAKGQLVIVGLSGHDRDKIIEWLAAAMKEKLADNLAALGTDGKPAPIMFNLTPPPKGTDWPLSPAAVQKAIIAANHPGLSRIRIERAYLTSSSAKADEANPTGVNWSYALSGIVIGTQPLPRADVDTITKDVMPAAFAAAKWTPITTGDLDKLTLADNRVPDPGPKFQKVIAEHPALDGVRLDAHTEFGSDGKLVLVGLQPGLDAKGLDELNTTIRAVLEALATGSDGNPLYKKLGDRGVSDVKLERVRVRELHTALQQWARDTLDETRLARLYFDANGVLTLTCDTPVPANEVAAKAELKKRATAQRIPLTPSDATPEKGLLPAPKGVKEPKEAKEPKDTKDNVGSSSRSAARLVGRSADDAKQPGTDPAVKPSPAPLKRSLVAFLQEETTNPKNKQWEAVLIERGFFNEKNEFTIRGVVNTEAQKRALIAYFDKLAKDPEWENYFKPASYAAPELEVIPMGKLVDRVQRVMPAYEVFDGIRVTNAKYVFEKDSKGADGQTLVFVAHLVGRTDREAPAKLHELIAEDAKFFGRRLPKGRMIRFEKDPDEVPSSELLGEFSIGYGATALSKGEMEKAKAWLDAGLLHYPQEAAIWFLSAYYHHLRGDEELARRDLYRMIDIEGRLAFDGPIQRKRRYLAAKDLQGERRNELEKLWLACWKEVKDGAQPMKFAAPK